MYRESAAQRHCRGDDWLFIQILLMSVCARLMNTVVLTVPIETVFPTMKRVEVTKKNSIVDEETTDVRRIRQTGSNLHEM